jgi:hypothetical protein
MPPRFRTLFTTASVADNPEGSFDDLPRQHGRADALRIHPADVLGTNYGQHLAAYTLAELVVV